MELMDVQNNIIQALQVFAERDRDSLLSVDNYEPAMNHRIAVYLEQLFPWYHVDCEYSKHLWVNKSIIRSSDGEEANIRPDIIIHKERNTDAENLVIFETKKYWYRTSLGEKDVQKIEDELTQLGYWLWVFVWILKKNIEILWIRKGASWDLVKAFELI